MIPIIRCQLFPTHQETNIQQQFRNLNWKKICSQQYSQKTGVTFNISESQKLIVPLYNQVKIDSSNQSGLLNYFKFSGPVYYHVTNRKVTEHFVNLKGNQSLHHRGLDKESKHLLSVTLTHLNRKIFASSYEIDSKTYQFQGWYKGKTKPENLEKSVTPSYDVPL